MSPQSSSRPGGTHHGDAGLGPYFTEQSPAAVAAALEALLDGDVRMTATQVVRRELTFSASGASYIEDVVADVRLRVMRRLMALRDAWQAGATDATIDNLGAYVATVAENACHALLRRLYPERTRFRNRVRYAVSHHPQLSLDREEGGVWRCSTRHAVRRAPEPGAAQQMLDDPRGWIASRRIDLSAPLPHVLDALLTGCDRPVELDRLVDALAPLMGAVDVQPAQPRADGTALREQADPTASVAATLEQRQTLASVWREIVDLPPRQRAALLLNLRDPEGGAVLHALPGTEVVDQAGIAGALGMTADQLAALWDRLPLDDLMIAAQLGLTRQQVINLRKSARARLVRRLGATP